MNKKQTRKKKFTNTPEVPEFVPTQEELLNLVKHWERIFLERSFFVFDTRQIERRDQLCEFAEGRVLRIIELVGLPAIEAVQWTQDEFAKHIASQGWKRFREYLGRDHIHGGDQEEGTRAELGSAPWITEADIPF